MFIAGLTIHSTRGEHDRINIFFRHFHRLLLLSTFSFNARHLIWRLNYPRYFRYTLIALFPQSVKFRPRIERFHILDSKKGLKSSLFHSQSLDLRHQTDRLHMSRIFKPFSKLDYKRLYCSYKWHKIAIR